MRRLRLADKEPIALETTLIPAAMLPDLKKIKDSLYTTLRELGHVPLRSVQRISAVNVDEESALLKLTHGAPALDIDRVTRMDDWTVVELSRSIFRGDAYDSSRNSVLVREPPGRWPVWMPSRGCGVE